MALGAVGDERARAGGEGVGGAAEPFEAAVAALRRGEAVHQVVAEELVVGRLAEADEDERRGERDLGVVGPVADAEADAGAAAHLRRRGAGRGHELAQRGADLGRVLRRQPRLIAGHRRGEGIALSLHLRHREALDGAGEALALLDRVGPRQAELFAERLGGIDHRRGGDEAAVRAGREADAVAVAADRGGGRAGQEARQRPGGGRFGLDRNDGDLGDGCGRRDRLGRRRRRHHDRHGSDRGGGSDRGRDRGRGRDAHLLLPEGEEEAAGALAAGRHQLRGLRAADDRAVVGGVEEGALVLGEHARRRIAEEGLVLADGGAGVRAHDPVGRAGREAEVVERALDAPVLLALVAADPPAPLSARTAAGRPAAGAAAAG